MTGRRLAAPPPIPGNIVAFPRTPAAPLPKAHPSGPARRAVLQSEDPPTTPSVRQLSEVEFSSGCLDLTAPSRFHAAFVTTHHLMRLLAVLRRVDGSVDLCASRRSEFRSSAAHAPVPPACHRAGQGDGTIPPEPRLTVPPRHPPRAGPAAGASIRCHPDRRETSLRR